MDIEIVIPPAHQLGTGNSHTARQWAEILRQLGHEVRVSEGDDGFAGELLVVLHGVKSRSAMVEYRRRLPTGRVVVCLTGTDLYGEQSADLVDSMREADRLVVLQSKALEQLPEDFRGKTRVIVQGAERMFGAGNEREMDPFKVCVVGHLREVKDPLRVAEAARLLPSASRIEIVQAGAILEERYRGLVANEVDENSRYRWLGELSVEKTRKLIAESQLMVISSLMEGGARVVGEAVVEGTPVLSSRIDGVVGLLGEDYPGYFEVGDTAGLARLLERTESDRGFREALRAGISRVAEQFDPQKESAAWESLLRVIDLS